MDVQETEAGQQAFLQRPLKMLIGGKWIEAASGKRFKR